nr:response regulator transcription factor [Aneurinibacillus terranovensis]
MEDKRMVLIVDDEKPMRQLLSICLRQAGYSADQVSSGEEAIAALQSKPYELILLDVMMPTLDGWETCEKIRQFSNVPIIMLTAREQTSDKVKGLALGADDYVTKPFDQEELLARVHAVLRRSESKNQETMNPDHLLNHQGITVDSHRHEAFFENQLLILTPKEYGILHILMKSPGRVFSREDLLALIWEGQDIEDERTVDTHVKNLREKLRAKGAPAHDIIKTVWGVGYKLQ